MGVEQARTETSTPRIPVLGLLALVWGSNFFWIKLALRGLAPDQVAFVRLTLGALVLVFVVVLRGDRLPTAPSLWWHLSVAAVLGNVAPYLLFALAEQRVDSSIAGIINATTPLWTVVVVVAVRHGGRLGAWRLTGTAIGFLGALLIFAPWTYSSQIMSRSGLECLLAAACYAVAFVYMARFVAPSGLPPLTLAAGQLAASAVLVSLTLPFLGRHALHLTAQSVGAALILGAIGTGLAYVLNYTLVAESGAAATSLVTYLIPIVAVILGVAVLGESLPWRVVAGAVIVLGGVAVTRRSAREPTKVT